MRLGSAAPASDAHPCPRMLTPPPFPQRRFKEAKRALNQWMKPETPGEWAHPLWQTRYALLASMVALESWDTVLAGRSAPLPDRIVCDSTCGDVDGNPGVHNWVAQGNTAAVYAWARARISYGAKEAAAEAQARLHAVAEEVEGNYPGRWVPARPLSMAPGPPHTPAPS